MIKVACLPTTIPSNFDEQLEEFSKQGFRVLGAAYKKLTKNSLKQELSNDQYE